MDNCLRRLKQELLSMKEAGDGLHAQMNSMMGALQELKLLQVQTALEQLEISNKSSLVIPQDTQSHRPLDQQVLDQQLMEQTSRGLSQKAIPVSGKLSQTVQSFSRESSPSPTALQVEPMLLFTSSPVEDHGPPSPRMPRHQGPRQALHRGSLSTQPSFSSSEDDSLPIDHRYSQESTTMWDVPLSPISGMPLEETQPHFYPLQMAELQGILDSLSREGPSIDSDFSQDDPNDSGDWTSSLMNLSRNRQPLVLGDNFFADLVGNWLDLPELESRITGDGEAGESLGEGAHPLRLSRSQEFCRRLSLTTNIFKKVLRSVRPDRDKLLKERPGWMPQEEEEAELLKRPKNKKVSKPKGTFYWPFRARTNGQKSKSRPAQGPSQEQCMNSEVHVGQGWSETVKKHQPIFDYSSAIWV
ncbi:PAK4-inhibitor INKA2 [Chanos chanos]|uniref:PAK4-inhibitor INKA2 n=1 Tax=Chanos chanos TaxID=29144 RepID=A0A6J2W7W5_CHACN|nr:PAK4-inhibitor INKA2-like [Chanos chanos]